MPKIKPKFAIKHAGRVMQQNSPTLLSAAAVAGVAATAFFTFKASWKAGRHVASREEMSEERDYRMPVAQAVQETWKLYIPAAGVGALTIGCIVASNRIQVRRLAAMAAAYGVLSGDFDEYRNKALEMLGDKKAKVIDDKMAEQKVHKNPPPKGVLPSEGKAWFVDLSTMHYFFSDRQEIEHAVNQLNYHLLHSGDMYATLNNYYAFLGIPTTNVGDQLGWTNEQQVEFIPTPVLMEDGSSATGIKLAPEPKPDFDSLH